MIFFYFFFKLKYHFKDNEFFLLTGMFRSGSTYLSRLLDNHKEIYCNSDIFFYVFKLLRYSVLKKKKFM